jgi:hypothetical protein
MDIGPLPVTPPTPRPTFRYVRGSLEVAALHRRNKELTRRERDAFLSLGAALDILKS